MLSGLEVDSDEAYYLFATIRSYEPLFDALKFTCAGIDLLIGICLVGLPGRMIGAKFDFAGQGSKTPLEEIEDIEILRFLEIGYEVRMVKVSDRSISIDVPADILKVEAAIRARASSAS
jgi:hypothetical protein